MRPLPPPFDDIVAGRPATITNNSGPHLLGSRMLTKEQAFTADERDLFHLHGLLPSSCISIESQVKLELEHLRRKSDDLERYIGLAALQDRNATLFYRLLTEHLEEFAPIVYTPTVGRACQEFSHIIRGTRGTWITPDDRDRIPQLLRDGPFPDVRIIVVTDNERILGLGDQGAGGMGIPIGKLALYTAGCGIHPAVTLPVSLDVGTDNPRLLDDPLYVGYRAPRLRGAAYDELIEAFVVGVQEVWPGCVVQWEDFKQQNALRILDRYRHRVCSFNDDIQGTSALVVAGVLAGLRARGTSLEQERIVLAGAGAAGIGIGRLLRAAMMEAGMPSEAIDRALVFVDSRGLVHAGRDDLDDLKRAVALPVAVAAEFGLTTPSTGAQADLLAVVRAVRPTCLVGATAVRGAFPEPVIREMAAASARPIIMPLSNPTSKTEATPEEIVAWTGGRAIVATGSPFPPVMVDGAPREVAQANNVFVFPGLGLGAIVTEARGISDRMILAAARALADAVPAERISAGILYPSIADLRAVSRAVALAVAGEAVRSGLATVQPDTDLEAEIQAVMWWPDYVPYRLPG